MPYKQKTKVLIFSLTYFPFVGGAEVALSEITQRIPEIDFDLITAKLSQELPNSETLGNLHIWRVGKGNKLDKYLYPLRAFLFSRKLHKKKQYNLIWAMLASWAGIAALLFKIFNPKVKYLLTLQSGDSDWFLWSRTWFWYPIYRMIYTRADHIQVISTWLKKRARRYGYQGEISLVPNGVDLKKFQISNFKFQIDELKREFNIPIKNKIIFTSSRLVKKNDIQTLIKSIQLLITHYPPTGDPPSPYRKIHQRKLGDSLRVTLLIAGTGKLEPKLKDLTQELKIEKNVIFLGYVERSQLFKYYQIADVFARPSLSEGQGISFIEAMAAGVPIIATPVGGIPDFLLDKKTGLFCQTKNPQDLAEKIKLLLADKELYKEIRTNGLALAKQKYDWDLIAKRMNNIFKLLSK